MKVSDDSVDEEETTSGFRMRDVPLLIVVLPFALLFGVHVAGLAMLIRKWVGIPYLASMLVFHGGLTIPLWYLSSGRSLFLPLSFSVAVLLFTIAPICCGGREEIMEGTNFESTAPPHLMICMSYIVYIFVASRDSNGHNERVISTLVTKREIDLDPRLGDTFFDPSSHPIRGCHILGHSV